MLVITSDVGSKCTLDIASTKIYDRINEEFSEMNKFVKEVLEHNFKREFMNSIDELVVLILFQPKDLNFTTQLLLCNTMKRVQS